jgi:hypothetical protein
MPKNDTTDPLNPRVLTARRLRRLGEEASGLRDKALRMVFREKGGRGADYYLVNPSDDPDGRGLPVNSEKDPPNTIKVVQGMKKVDLEYGNHVERNAEELYDALFWSDAAIEKFLIDYYLPILEPLDWLALYLRVTGIIREGKPIYGIGHTYPTVFKLLNDDPVDFLTEDGPVKGQAFLEESVGFFRKRFL